MASPPRALPWHLARDIPFRLGGYPSEAAQAETVRLTLVCELGQFPHGWFVMYRLSETTSLELPGLRLCASELLYSWGKIRCFSLIECRRKFAVFIPVMRFWIIWVQHGAVQSLNAIC